MGVNKAGPGRARNQVMKQQMQGHSPASWRLRIAGQHCPELEQLGQAFMPCIYLPVIRQALPLGEKYDLGLLHQPRAIS